jgi:hypothetical protein
MDNFNTELDYLLSVLDNSLFKAQELLATLSFDANFSQKVKLAFGGKIDTAKVESLLREFSQQNSLYLPKIEIRFQSEINGAKAAFAGENHTIYVAQEFLRENANNTDNIAAVLLEELGHAIDFQVNPVDTPGDEGELFSALVRGVDLGEGELQRIKTEDDSAIATIGGETFPIEQSNYSLGLVEGNWLWDDSVDYFDYGDNWTFQISATGGIANYVSVSSNFTNIDLILQLTDAFGYVLESDVNDFNYNFESISLNGLPAGVYTATVYDFYQGQYVYPSSASYTLNINAPSISQDLYEPNGNFQSATVLNTSDGYELLSNLSIHSSTDTDFFRFTTVDLSTDNNYIAAYFDWTQGVIDLNLFDASGNFLYYALGSYGWNYIPLSGLAAGTYYVQAGSYQGNTSPFYTLEFNTPITLSGDRFEPNDTSAGGWK